MGMKQRLAIPKIRKVPQLMAVRSGGVAITMAKLNSQLLMVEIALAFVRVASGLIWNAQRLAIVRGTWMLLFPYLSRVQPTVRRERASELGLTRDSRRRETYGSWSQVKPKKTRYRNRPKTDPLMIWTSPGIKHPMMMNMDKAWPADPIRKRLRRPTRSMVGMQAKAARA